MPVEVLRLLDRWEDLLPARRCECGALVPDAVPGQPCEDCLDRLLTEERDRNACWTCDGSGFVRPAGHWADDMRGWTPCHECGDWGDVYD